MMAINVFRHNPPRFASIIKKTYDDHPQTDRKGEKQLIDFVKKLNKLPGVSFDPQLNAAVRKNNAAVTCEDIREPKEGGNFDALQKEDSSVKVEECEEITMV